MLAFFARVGDDAAATIMHVMRRGLHRYCRADRLHFIPCSCSRRMPGLRFARSRDRVLSALEQTCKRYRLVVVGYVVMPEHIHEHWTKPDYGRRVRSDPSTSCCATALWLDCQSLGRVPRKLQVGQAHAVDDHLVGADIVRRLEAVGAGIGNIIVLIDAIATHS